MKHMAIQVKDCLAREALDMSSDFCHHCFEFLEMHQVMLPGCFYP